MNKQSMHPGLPFGVKFLSIINGVGFVVTLLFWTAVFIGHAVPYPSEASSVAEKANSSVTYGFLIGDVIYSLPLLLLATFGVWRLKSWGWMTSQMVNILWMYSMTVVLTRDFNTTITPGGLVFTPFALVAAWAVPYLWKRRALFEVGR